MGAIFSESGLYRYALWREWDSERPRVAFIMLNPSTADAIFDDPTIRRCVSFARSWGYGSLEVVNLFAYRTVHPVLLRQAPDPVGLENDRYLLRACRHAAAVVAGWGNHGTLHGRNRVVSDLLSGQSQLHCLGMTKAGHPRHPLYLKGDTVPVPFLVN